MKKLFTINLLVLLSCVALAQDSTQVSPRLIEAGTVIVISDDTFRVTEDLWLSTADSEIEQRYLIGFYKQQVQDLSDEIINLDSLHKSVMADMEALDSLNHEQLEACENIYTTLKAAVAKQSTMITKLESDKRKQKNKKVLWRTTALTEAVILTLFILL